MRDRIDFGSDPWQAIPSRVLRDERLTARAKGGLVTLLSHEEGWVRSCIAVLQRECRCGAKQAQAIMAELRELGYAELITERIDNRISKHYVITAMPKSEGSQAVLTAGLTSTNPARHESDRSAEGAVVVEALEVEALEVEALEQKPTPPRKRDVLADALARAEGADPLEVPASRMRTLCVKAAELRRLNADITPAEVARRAENWTSHFERASISGPAIVEHWGRLGHPGSGGGGDEAGRRERILAIMREEKARARS